MSEVTFNLQLDGDPHTYTKERIRTSDMRFGSMIWVPEEERANVGVLNVDHNGNYNAYEEGVFGWSQVNVKVAGGNDAEINNGTEEEPDVEDWTAPSVTTNSGTECGTGDGVKGMYNNVKYHVRLGPDGILIWTEIV